ncbi:unnamed protein product [Pedinophyceae sp. YPF-701]|nr:unnamed protein product [Pedinophyceae sp. YPF-701]
MFFSTLHRALLSPEDLENSPSRQDGVSHDLEEAQRIFGCDIVAETGLYLRMPNQAVCTAQVLLQRFYCKRSLTKYDVKDVALACLWLASKLEECPKRARDVLMVGRRIIQRHSDAPLTVLDFYGSEYARGKETLIRTERNILRVFGFICHVELPHNYLLSFLQQLQADAAFVQDAWDACNDSHRAPVCITHAPEAVACACILVAARRKGHALPARTPWWQAFGPGRAEVETAAVQLARLYARPDPARYEPLTQAAKDAAAAAAKEAKEAASPQRGPESAGTPDRRGRSATPEVEGGSAEGGVAGEDLRMRAIRAAQEAASRATHG